MNAVLKPSRLPRLFPVFALLILAYTGLLSQLAAPRQLPDLLTLAMTCDLVLGIPLMYYFMVAKPLKKPAITALGVYLLAVLAGSLLLHSEHQRWLRLAEAALVLSETVLFGYGLLKLRQIAQAWRRQSDPGRLERLEASLGEVMGKNFGVRLLASELALISYAFAPGKVEQRPDQPAFSSHRKTAYGAYIWAVLMLSAVETFGLHLLLGRWNETVAWALSGIGIYGSLIVVAELRAHTRRPHLIENQTLVLRRGLIWRTRIPLNQIASLEPLRQPLPKAPDLVNFGLVNPRWLLTLKQPVEVEGLYGIRRRPCRIMLELDEPEALRRALGL